MSQAINRYRADLREIQFVLFEQHALGELLGKGPFTDWQDETVRMALAEAYRFAKDVLGPLHSSGDREGCKIVDGRVVVPQGFKDAWNKLYEAGWRTVAVAPEHGGQGAPRAIAVAVEEFLSGANMAFNMYPGLTYGAAELIEGCATPDQKHKYLDGMFNGRLGGTMCLTESQAGSDVGAARTTATKNADGTYSIRGTKIFISSGDHDMAPSIVHLVLARVENAPPGTRGLSLFIVPSKWINDDGSIGEDNDVSVGSIEHKMGINGSATCVLNFGENGKCRGELVGGVENRGMSQMFLMMNFARIAVGIQGVSLASTAYLNALDYARERKQGAPIHRWKDATAPRAAIIEHPDVRRMLLDMKSRVEGLRALILKLAIHEDYAHSLAGKDDDAVAYHRGQIELLTPIVKSYGSDQGFKICETAIQTFGGAGYTKDYPVEQYCRDSKILSIYEGTNHIQAMDLVGRKLGQNGGAHTQQFLADIGKFVATHSAHPVFGAEVTLLGTASEALSGTIMRLLGWFQGGQIPLVPLVANRFLEIMAEVSVAWMLLDGAIIADKKLAGLTEADTDFAFYTGKKHAALFYARSVLPLVESKARVIGEGDSSPIDIPDAAFATL